MRDRAVGVRAGAAAVLAATLLAALGGCRTSVGGTFKEMPCMPMEAPCAPPVPSCDPCLPDPLKTYSVEPRHGFYMGPVGSIFPNVGLGFEGGFVVRRDSCAVWSVEAQGVWQFIDDKTFIDDDNPEAGDWYQARVGIKMATNPGSRRHWTARVGAVWFDAQGDFPNWVDEPGEYYGGYVEGGFETDLTENFSAGPGLSLMPVFEADDGHFILVPMLNWHFTWWPGGTCEAYRSCETDCRARARPYPPGEFYVDAVAAAGPNLGGGLAFGQVFRRSHRATSSFELEAVWNEMGDWLLGEGDGNFAQIRGGAKVVLRPKACSHPVLRAGGTWFRSTAPISTVDESPGDFYGIYLGAGWEWDLSERVSTGPEVSAAFVTKESFQSFGILPRVSWHLTFKF